MTHKIEPCDIFLKGKYVILKALTESDVHNSNWYGWFNNPELTAFTRHGRFPHTKEEQLQFFKDNIQGARNRLQLGICESIGGSLIGVIALNNIDYISRTCQIAIMIGEKKFQNLKFALESYRLLFRHAFLQLNIRRIYDGVHTEELAQLLCRTLGFKQEGVRREQLFKNGQYLNDYLLGIMKEEFFAHKANLTNLREIDNI